MNLPPSPVRPAAKGAAIQWTTGTLTYTTAGLAALFCWLLWGDFAWSMRDRSVPAIIQILFKRFEASDTLVGILTGSLPPILSMVVGPVISYKSDRHRGRWGRRIPFLLIPTPLIVASMIGVCFSSQLGALLRQVLGEHALSINVSVLLFLGLFWTLFEFGCITANSVFGALVNDVVPKPVLGRFFALFRALSLIAGIVFNYWMIAKAEVHYIVFFLCIAALYGVGFTLMCLNVKEGEYPPPLEPAPDAPNGFFAAASDYFRNCFGKPYYLWFFAMMASAALANGPVNVFALFYAQSVAMSMAAYGKCLALTYVISLVLAYPLGALADRFHPLRLSLVLLGLYIGVGVWGGLYARNSTNFSIAFVAHGVLTGAYLTASASMGQKLLPSARFAELMSASGIVTCLCSAAIAPCMGVVLDRTGHSYHYTFYAGGVLALAAVALNWVMYVKFAALGGVKEYAAPE
ncbi:MAG: MFS transporter [Chthoniobacteraceae bacterium]